MCQGGCFEQRNGIMAKQGKEVCNSWKANWSQYGKKDLRKDIRVEQSRVVVGEKMGLKSCPI